MSHNGSILIAALRRRFRYDPHTGEVFYRISTRKFNVDDLAGSSIDSNGYRTVYVSELERTVYLHCVCFALHHGGWPKLVDHEDGDTLNNRGLNLREATRRQNAMNAKIKSGSSQYRGVVWKRNRWNTRIRCAGVLYDLGLFDGEEDAALAYNRKALELFGKYARLNPVQDDGRPIQRRPARY